MSKDYDYDLVMEDVDLETDLEELDLDSETTDKSKKEFTYAECLKFSEAKGKIINSYQLRAEGYHFLLSRLAQKGKTVNPKDLLNSFAEIDRKYPIVMEE